MKPSRYLRPAVPPPIQLQPRDRDILAAVFAHRYLSAEHLRLLVFPASSRRAVQARLRHLWAHQLLDRHFIPFVLDGARPPPRTAGVPLYRLAKRGAAIVAGNRGVDVREIPHTPEQNAVGYATLEHHLVATDLLVSLTAACRGRQDVTLVRVERETVLRARAGAYSAAHGGRSLVPDGAFTLHYPPVGARWTFYVEVVRASVKGGNDTIRQRFLEYLDRNRSGYFRAVHGHERVRAVLFLTPSEARADNLRQLAERLPNGRRLFWFGWYEKKDERGRAVSTLTPETILAPRWLPVDGDRLSFIPAAPDYSGAPVNPPLHV